MDGGGYTVYIAQCIVDQSPWCACGGACLVSVHEDHHTITRVRTHSSALQYDHRALKRVAYDESKAPR